jgi:hypothetical protein
MSLRATASQVFRHASMPTRELLRCVKKIRCKKFVAKNALAGSSLRPDEIHPRTQLPAGAARLRLNRSTNSSAQDARVASPARAYDWVGPAWVSIDCSPAPPAHGVALKDAAVLRAGSRCLDRARDAAGSRAFDDGETQGNRSFRPVRHLYPALRSVTARTCFSPSEPRGAKADTCVAGRASSRSQSAARIRASTASVLRETSSTSNLKTRYPARTSAASRRASARARSAR